MINITHNKRIFSYKGTSPYKFPFKYQFGLVPDVQNINNKPTYLKPRHGEGRQGLPPTLIFLLLGSFTFPFFENK